MSDEPKDGALATRAQAAEHFRIDSSALSFGELWSASKLAFPITAIMKLAGISSPVSLLAPLSTSLQRLEWDALPPRGREQLRAVVRGLENMGFTEALLFAEDWRAFKIDCVSVALLDEANTTLVLAMYTSLYRFDGVPYGEHVDLVFYSFRDDGRVVVTRSSPYPMHQPPEYDAVHVDARPAADVATLHASRMKTNASDQNKPYRTPGAWQRIEPDEVPGRALALSRREAQFQVERGVYVAASPQDLAVIEAAQPPAKRTTPGRVLVLWAVVVLLMLLLANLL